MFIQAALLLFVAHAFYVETFKVEDHHKHFGIRNIENPKILKTHKILKNIGKRYFPSNLKDRKEVPDFEEYVPDLEYRNPSWSNLPWDTEFREWDLTSDDEVNKRRERTARMMVQSLVASTSMKNNFGFTMGVNNINTVLDPEFFAEICEDGKQLNKYQYYKFVIQSAAQYKNKEEIIDYELLETDRRSIHVKTKFVTLDNNGLKVQIEYEFKMKLTFSSEWFFSLIYLKQGGSCANEGKANMELGDGVKDIVAEELEGLKTAPTMKLFFDLFTPTIFKDIQEDPYYLPMHWLSGLNSSVVQINVCQDGVVDNVKYTIDEFRTWYEKFDIMWHQKALNESDFITQILELTSGSISARITMRLQMGLNPEELEHDWNFKFTGKKMDGVWVLDTVNVLCTPTVNYKDQSLKNIKDVVVAKFMEELAYLNDTQWYFATEYIRTFSKHGEVEITDCVKGEEVPINRADLFAKDKTNQHGIKFTMYAKEQREVPMPAPDTMIFRFDTIGVPADSTSNEEKKEYEWSYEVKWDQKDQFYYIQRMGIGCAKPWTLAKVFEPISFVPIRRRLPHLIGLGK